MDSFKKFITHYLTITMKMDEISENIIRNS